MNSLGWLSIICISVGMLQVIYGFIRSKDPLRFIKWLYLGGLTFISPMVITMIIYAARGDFYSLPPAFMMLEALLIAVIVVARFKIKNERTARNILLVCNIYSLILLLAILIPSSMENDGFTKNFRYKEISGDIAITGYEGKGKQAIIPSVIEGKSVITLYRQAFLNNKYITDISIPNSVTDISASAFAYCSSLENITISNSVTRIENDTFCGCSSLKNITIPDSVTRIGDRAFYDCKNLSSVTIPSSVRSIGEMAFSNSDQVVIYCYEYSYAKNYAVGNQIDYVLIDN